MKDDIWAEVNKIHILSPTLCPALFDIIVKVSLTFIFFTYILLISQQSIGLS